MLALLFSLAPVSHVNSLTILFLTRPTSPHLFVRVCTHQRFYVIPSNASHKKQVS